MLWYDVRKIGEGWIQLHGLVKKTTEKLENQISNFAELEPEKPLHINPANIKCKLENMAKWWILRNLKNEFNLLKKRSQGI